VGAHPPTVLREQNGHCAHYFKRTRAARALHDHNGYYVQLVQSLFTSLLRPREVVVTSIAARNSGCLFRSSRAKNRRIVFVNPSFVRRFISFVTALIGTVVSP
jgi:hypothetical protein